MNRLRASVMVAALTLASAQAGAATPPAQQYYQVSLGGPNAAAKSVAADVMGWIDETDLSASVFGTVHPVSQTEALPVTCISGCGAVTPVSSAPTGFSASLTTTAAPALGAGSYRRISFVIQGTGAGCYSFTSAAPAISGTTCSNGYPVSAGSTFNSSTVAAPNTALYVVESSGSSLTIYGDYQ